MIGVRECANCHEVRKINARGLCMTCYNRHRLDGTLDRFPTGRRALPSGHPGKKVLIEEYTHMRALLGHEGAVWRLCDAYSIDEITLRKSLDKYERQAA